MSEQKIRDALASLLEIESEECRFDHKGYCQAHNLDHIKDGCRVALAREALAQQPTTAIKETAAVPTQLTAAIVSHCNDLKRTAEIVREIGPFFEKTASEIDLAAIELLSMLEAAKRGEK